MSGSDGATLPTSVTTSLSEWQARRLLNPLSYTRMALNQTERNGLLGGGGGRVTDDGRPSNTHPVPFIPTREIV